MGNSKNKHSTKIHSSRARVRISRPAASRDNNRRLFATAKKTTLTIIILAMLVVILTLLLRIFSNPERIIKKNIETIVSDYYENYFYEDIITYATTSKSLDEVMEKYTKSGFSQISFRQLLIYDSKTEQSVINEYCDIEDSYVKIYPEPPFSKTDYRIDYHYSCNF